jgi:hypothetical protein
MKQRIFGWISVLVGIVMALAAIELTAIVWLYLEDGRYVSAEELFQRTQNTYVRDSTRGTPIWRSCITAIRRAACPTSTISAC